MESLYKRIEEMCVNNNINVTTMCSESGASRGSLTDLKKGRKQSLSADTLRKIAEYFGVTVDYLLTGEKEKPTTESDELYDMLEDVRRNPDLRAMFSLTKKATPDQLRQYINVIKALKGDNDDE